jgi:hypothetical protein
MTAVHTSTLLDLVQTVSEFAINDEEILAAVTHLVNSGRVRLGGIFAGARIDLAPQTRVRFPRFPRTRRASRVGRRRTVRS